MRKSGVVNALLGTIPILLQLLVAYGGEPHRDGDWVTPQDAPAGETILTMRIAIHPQGEPLPALAYRLIPDEFEQRDGNAALYYLKAMGFLEQQLAQSKLREFISQERQSAVERGDASQAAPYIWMSLPIGDLPLAEMRDYLQWTEFQSALLETASKQNHFSMDRHIREVENPVAYLLPEIQAIREMARNQSIRCRLAIAEERANDAVTVLRQQFAMAHHLGHDQFLVSNLVASAVSGLAITDALQYVQMKDAPNLYWAIAALPDPLIDMRDAYAYERQFLLEQIKVLREVDETQRSIGYWQEFIDRLLPQLAWLELENFRIVPTSGDMQVNRSLLVTKIAAAYPKARRYLIDEWGMDEKQVDAYPTAQVVFLALVRFHSVVVDQYFKWTHISMWQARANQQFENLDQWLQQQMAEVGWAGTPVGLFLAAIPTALAAQYRTELSLAMVQTVEALRIYAADNDGQLPQSLSKLTVPIPIDPFTGKPIEYVCDRSQAVLTGSQMGRGLKFRLLIEMAE